MKLLFGVMLSEMKWARPTQTPESKAEGNILALNWMPSPIISYFWRQHICFLLLFNYVLLTLNVDSSTYIYDRINVKSCYRRHLKGKSWTTKRKYLNSETLALFFIVRASLMGAWSNRFRAWSLWAWCFGVCVSVRKLEIVGSDSSALRNGRM